MTDLPSFIDTHTHLDAPDFSDEVEAVVARAVAAGVTTMITIGAGYGIESAKRAVALADRFETVWASVGVHPHNAGQPFDPKELAELASRERVVAIGETGLDFFRDWAPVDEQRRVFRLQIELALEVGKPLVIHSRNAGAECMAILREYPVERIGGVFHCYAEDAEYARALRKINFMVSFPGPLTFKKSEALREICREIPVDQMMLETDAPFLAPEPHRGKRCESSLLPITAATMARVKGLEVGQLAEITSENARRLFRGLR